MLCLSKSAKATARVVRNLQNLPRYDFLSRYANDKPEEFMKLEHSNACAIYFHGAR